MAINTKKRARVNTMMTPSSNSTTTSSSSASCYSSSDQEEYERAVAFLREFHSRRVVAQATFLHSTSIDAILEADHFDEMLASDFSLALSVGQHRSSSSGDLLNGSGSVSDSNNKSMMMKRNEESFLQVIVDAPPLNGYATTANDGHQQQHQRRTTSRLRRNPSSLSRMKKTTASKCLLDLDDSTSSSLSDLKECPSSASTTASGGLQRSSPSLFAECGGGLLRTVSPTPESSTLDTDYFFGYDDDESLPMAKRHRSSHYVARITS